MITLRHERPADIPAREALLDEAFGDTRRERPPSVCAKAACRPRGFPSSPPTDAASSAPPGCGPSPAPADERPCCSARWRSPPTAAAPGIGAALVRKAIREARKAGHGAIVLVGDPPYYGRFGFTAEKTASLRLPGPFERRRLLALELVPGALDGAGGMIDATGRRIDAAESKIAAHAA